MLNEVEILFDNVRHFRKLLLKEEVSDNMIVDAIHNRKIIYIYYAGDNTNRQGYRTIRPMVYGVSTAGNRVIRAWQEAGASDSAVEKGNKYADAKGRLKPGWRLFRVDSITSFLPTGKHFSNNDDKIPPKYDPNDDQMKQIIASVKPAINTKFKIKGLGKPEEPVVTQTKVPKAPQSVFANQAQKFKYFSDAAKKTREATKDEIENLYQISKKIRKKAPSQMLVVQDENGDMVIKDIAIKDKLPPDSIVGNLDDLYQKLVASEKPVDTTFRDQEYQKTVDAVNKMK